MATNTFHMKKLLELLILSVCLYGCQSGKLPLSAENADLLYEKRHYYEAAAMYNKLVKKESDEKKRRDQTIKLANSYRQMNDYPMALAWYRKVVAENPDQPAYLYLYADLLMSNNNYEDALTNLKLYNKEVPGDKRSKDKIAICEDAIKIDMSGSRYIVKPVNLVNSEYNDFCPSITADGLYFTSDRSESTGDEKYPWLGTYYSDIFLAPIKDDGFDKPKPVEGSVNSDLNEGATSFNESGSVMIFTQCSGQGFDSSCALLVTTKDGNQWKKPQALAFTVTTTEMYGQPALSKNAKQLIFVSNRPGGYGGHDLYVSVKNGGKWSTPKNMGPNINTAGDEMFPYLLEDNMLYFSSNGHAGFGALDIFLVEKRKNKWRKPRNLLPPMNSGGDDFGICFSREGAEANKGYFSSNRPGTQRDDIFTFDIITPPLCTVCGTVFDKKTKAPVPSATVYLTNLTSEETVFIKTDAKGNYCMKLQYEQDYKMDAYKKFYANTKEKPRLSTKGLNFKKEFKRNFFLEKWTIDEIEIEGILYDLDSDAIRKESAEILDSLSSILKTHYYLVVELSSHTDCRGSVEYNQDLSQRRAQSCVDYLVSKGVASERLKAKGYGETKLLNDCACEGEEGKGLDCTEEQHQGNRRTSFQILRTDFQPVDEVKVGTRYEDPEEE